MHGGPRVKQRRQTLVDGFCDASLHPRDAYTQRARLGGFLTRNVLSPWRRHLLHSPVCPGGARPRQVSALEQGGHMAMQGVHRVSAMSATTFMQFSVAHNRHGSGGSHTRQKPSFARGVLYVHDGVEQGHRLRLQNRQRECSCEKLEQRGVLQTGKCEISC